MNIIPTIFFKSSKMELMLSIGENMIIMKFFIAEVIDFHNITFMISCNWYYVIICRYDPTLSIFCYSGIYIIFSSIYINFFLRSEEHTSELQSRPHLVCRLL